MADNILKIALENPTVESLIKLLQELAEAYKKLEAKCDQLERENERLRRQLNVNFLRFVTLKP